MTDRSWVETGLCTSQNGDGALKSIFTLSWDTCNAANGSLAGTFDLRPMRRVMWKTSASAVAAQPQYNNRDDVLKLLAKQYQEAPGANTTSIHYREN